MIPPVREAGGDGWAFARRCPMARPRRDLGVAPMGGLPTSFRVAEPATGDRVDAPFRVLFGDTSMARSSPRRGRSFATATAAFTTSSAGAGATTWPRPALTAVHLHDGRERGCQSASLQSTPMAERVYAAAGFRGLGRIFEYVP